MTVRRVLQKKGSELSVTPQDFQTGDFPLGSFPVVRKWSKEIVLP